jgi:putative zinc finger/helix-turn-helix YgiT family protein
MRCPTCKKENSLRPWEGTTTVMGVELEGSGQRCGPCGEVLIELTERGRQERLAAERLVARGVRSGIEFRFVRKLAGLRANEVAALFGVRKETVSRWERGEVEIPRIAAYALGSLLEHPKLARQRLEAFDQPPGGHEKRPAGAARAGRRTKAPPS